LSDHEVLIEEKVESALAIILLDTFFTVSYGTDIISVGAFPTIMEHHESVNIDRTERCLEKIKAYKRGGARTILLFGKPGVGKSSLAEHITGTSGLSKDSETGICCVNI
jgi:putative protein kinase ArgK-like GTPase of G3E family